MWTPTARRLRHLPRPRAIIAPNCTAVLRIRAATTRPVPLRRRVLRPVPPAPPRTVRNLPAGAEADTTRGSEAAAMGSEHGLPWREAHVSFGQGHAAFGEQALPETPGGVD